MPGRLGWNLRKGHLAEDIGINVLRTFSAVSDVRHQDDIGVDAYCVLLRPQNRMLHAGAVFSVQVKAASVKTIEYEGDAAIWFLGIQVPLFFARVNAASGSMEFFTSSRYRRQLYYSKNVTKITFDFESTESDLSGHTIESGLHPPILQCSEAQSRTDEFAYLAHSHFSKWIAFESHAIDLQRFNIHLSPRWEAGGEPQPFFEGSNTTLEERTQHMNAALPIVGKLCYHALGTSNCDPDLLRAFLRICDWYREEGFDAEEALPLEILAHTVKTWQDRADEKS